jgi:hypothetical protein
MQLNAYVSEKRRKIFDDLTAVRPPSEGVYDESVLADGRARGLPLLGATRYRPDALILEFIYPADSGASVIFTVTLPVPERVVFLPVPPWVIESIWQGEIDGTYHFESDARKMLAEFAEVLLPDKNAQWFGPRQAKRRE